VLSRIVDFDYARSPLIRVDERVAVDFGNSKLVVENRPVMLTPTEANLLHILLRNAGRVVTSDMLIARVWPADEVYEDTLRVHMHRLRRKIEADVRHPKYIQTERGVGYRFMQVGTQSVRQMNVTSTRHSRS
jgi:DNA-binding response OmpR family regulator